MKPAPIAACSANNSEAISLLAGSMIGGFAVESFWSAFFGALLYSVISWALSSLLVPGKR